MATTRKRDELVRTRVRGVFNVPFYVVFLSRALAFLFRHPTPLLLLVFSTYVFFATDLSAFASYIVFPLLILFFRVLLTLVYLWYRNPEVPFFARKNS